MRFRRWRNYHATTLIDRDTAATELSARQFASLRASVESVRADAAADVAQRTADLAESEARLLQAVREVDRRLSAGNVDYGDELRTMTADLHERLGELRTSLAGENAWSNGNFANLSKRIDEQAGAQKSANEAQAAALDALQIAMSSVSEDLNSALRATQKSQIAAIQALRDSITADKRLQAELNEALQSGIVEIKALHSTALKRAAESLETRIARLTATHADALNTAVSSLESRVVTSAEEQSRALQAATAAVHSQMATLARAHESHVVALEAMGSAQSESISKVLEEQQTVVDRLTSSDATIDRIASRLSSAEERVNDALSAASRVDGLGRLLDEIRDRLATAEGLLQQRDMTDLELQLDRMESFERLAAEINPDQFAAKAEVDGLRTRLAKIELNASRTPEV